MQKSSLISDFANSQTRFRAIVMVCLPFFALPKLMSDVFVMQAAMPAMTNTSIVAKVYGGDYKYAAMLTVVSTLLAVITTPFYMWVLRG